MSEKRRPLGGYKDQTTSLHLTTDLLAKIRAAATATEPNQSDIMRTGVKRYIEMDLIPNMTPSEKERYDLALKMELEALSIPRNTGNDDDDFLSQL